MKFDSDFLQQLFAQAEANPRKRQHFDLRTSPEDNSQRMLNALLPGTEVAVHRHPSTAETVVCLCGRLDEILYEELLSAEQPTDSSLVCSEKSQGVLREIERITLCPAEGKYGCQVPKGVWHTVEVIEPSVIFEAKDGAYEPFHPEDVWKR